MGRVKNILQLTRPHSRTCIRIYIFKFIKQQTNNNNKKKESKKSKKGNGEKTIFSENRLKKLDLRW